MVRIAAAVLAVALMLSVSFMSASGGDKGSVTYTDSLPGEGKIKSLPGSPITPGSQNNSCDYKDYEIKRLQVELELKDRKIALLESKIKVLEASLSEKR